MSHDNISQLGEFGLISRLTRGVQSGCGVITGIGDDAAVTQPTPGMQLLTSTDLLSENIHFRKRWHPPYSLGRKSLAVNLSDIAAMGGIPRWALLSLGIPPDLTLDFLDEFSTGFLAMATEHDVTLIGGDTCSSKAGLTISVTIMGEQYPQQIIRRSGAVCGDEIWCTGTLGGAALALQLLEGGADQTPENDAIMARLLDPAPRVSTGRALSESGLVSAMIDISDGILADFGHIAELSGVGGQLFAERLPLPGGQRQIEQPEGRQALERALTGGEDYELCFTARPDNHEKIASLAKKCGVAATPVGIVTDSKNVVVCDSHGTPLDMSRGGFNHFS